MGRIIRISNSSRERQNFIRIISQTIQMLKSNEHISSMDRNDAIAFIVLTLLDIRDSVDQTVHAWEKRDYWVKADKFKLQWSWVDQSINIILENIHRHTLNNIDPILSEIAEKGTGVFPIKKKTGNIPWKGSWEKLLSTAEGQLL